MVVGNVHVLYGRGGQDAGKGSGAAEIVQPAFGLVAAVILQHAFQVQAGHIIPGKKIRKILQGIIQALCLHDGIKAVLFPPQLVFTAQQRISGQGDYDRCLFRGFRSGQFGGGGCRVRCRHRSRRWSR